jgi:hypothetical protein
MRLLSQLAYSHYIGPLPMIAVVGLVAYGLFLIAALVMAARRINRRFARTSFVLHRWFAGAGLLVATFHLLLGLSAYV